MRLLAPLALIVCAVPAAAQDLVAKTNALSPADEQKGFKLPDGFAVQLVAAEPDIQKPMQMAFDGRGRMWVTTSHLYPFAAEPGKGTDKLFVLSDFDATGKAKKIEVFDEKLNIPIGVLPLPDGKSVIVSECGSILKLTDTDADGKADKREVLFGGFGFKDTHGMTNSFTLLPDGWVYACHGFSNESKTKGTDGHEVELKSGNTFRFRPDGSRIEAYTRGQVNPFGIAVDPWLNLYTADCHSKPITQLVRGSYYDSFGKPHDGLGYGPHTTAHSHNSTGICGPLYYAADHFPKEWNGRMLVCNVVTSRLNADTIEWKGSTPVAKELKDFMTSDDPWFRPVDLKLGPDGAVYVADFYNKIIGHYEVDLKHPQRDHDHGRLWRIVWTGKDAKAPEMPRADWAKCEDAVLLEDFASPNVTVRLLAANEARRRGAKFEPDPAKIADGTLTTQAGLLAMARGLGKEFTALNSKSLIEAVAAKKLPADAQTGLVVKAVTSATDWGDTERKFAVECLKTFDGVRVKRAVIDGMTAHPHADFVQPLLDLIPKIAADDTHLKHAAKIALRNCLDTGGGKAIKLSDDEKPGVYRPLVDALLGCTDPAAVGILVQMLHSLWVPDELKVEVGRRIGRYGDAKAWLELGRLVAADTRAGGSAATVRMVVGALRGIQESGYKFERHTGPAPEFASLLTSTLDLGRTALTHKDATVRPLAMELYREARKATPAELLPWRDERQLPTHIVSSDATTVEEKLTAVEVVFLFGGPVNRDGVRALVGKADPDSAARGRVLPLLLATSPTTADCQMAVTAIKMAPYTQAVGYAVALAGDKFGADLLLAGVKSGEAPARLLQEKTVLDRLKATGVKDLEARVKVLTAGIPAVEKKIEQLITARSAGFPKAKADAAKGKAVFTKNCAVCHQLNNEGAKVGPQLDGIGIRGAARLLEDTLDPNRNVDHAFRATKLDLKDGQSLTGLVKEDGAVLVLTDAAGKEHRVPTADVDKKTTGTASAMPANLDTVMTEEEYYHLLAFLLEQRPKK